MSNGTLVGFFAGSLVIDENVTALAPMPKDGDGKLVVRSDSEYAGGSAANAAVTFGKLAKLDINGGGTAHLYTYSEARTPAQITSDLERHSVHLKKLGIVDELGHNTIVSFSETGQRLVIVRQTQPPHNFSRNIATAQRNLDALAGKLRALSPDSDTLDAFDLLSGSLTRTFAEASAYLPQPAANVENHFKADLEASKIAMVDLHYPDITLKTAKAANALKIPVIFDLGRWVPHAESLIKKSDIVIASSEFSTPDNPNMTPEEILNYLRIMGVKRGAVTCGGNDTLYYDDIESPGDDYKSVTAPQPFSTVSASGAGDIMHGAFCYFLARGESFKRSLELANRVASLSLSFPDTRQHFEFISFDAAGNLQIQNPLQTAESEPQPIPT